MNRVKYPVKDKWYRVAEVGMDDKHFRNGWLVGLRVKFTERVSHYDGYSQRHHSGQITIDRRHKKKFVHKLGSSCTMFARTIAVEEI